MARKLCKIIAALVSAAMLALPGAAFAAEAEKPYAEGRILVKLARTEEREGAARMLTARNASGARIAGMTVAKSWDFSQPAANARTNGMPRALRKRAGKRDYSAARLGFHDDGTDARSGGR